MGESLKTLDCAGRTTREINVFLKAMARMGPEAEVVLRNPDSRHNLGVGITTPLKLHIEGPVGYYCAGLCEGVDIRITGDAGWGLAENLMSGRVQLSASAGSSAGATMRGGTPCKWRETATRARSPLRPSASGPEPSDRWTPSTPSAR